MIDPQSVKRTRATAEDSLALMQQTDPETWSGLRLSPDTPDERSVFWWYGELPLVEIPLKDQSGAPSGYLLVSGDERLPPTMECAASGLPRSQLFGDLLRRVLQSYSGTAKFQRYVFFTSTEIYAEISYNDEVFRI